MPEKVKDLSIGDRVAITKEGARAHQQFHDDHVYAASKISVPHIGTVAGVVKQIVFTFPESGCKGTVVDVKRRWWGQPGHDYLVKWDGDRGQSWHLLWHLLPVE